MERLRPKLGLHWLLSWEGRIGRTDFAIRVFIALLAQFTLLLLLADLGQEVALIVSIVIALSISLSAQKRRLNDFGASGYWILLSLVPIANVGYALMLLFRAGDRGSNSWGHPQGLPTWEEGGPFKKREKSILLAAFLATLTAGIVYMVVRPISKETSYAELLLFVSIFIGFPISLFALIPWAWRWFLARISELSRAIRGN